MRRVISSLAILTLLLGASESGVDAQDPEPPTWEARAGEIQDIVVGDAAVFDASRSSLPATEEPITYLWSFGDGTQGTGERVTHAYRRNGSYAVRLTIRVGNDSRDDTTRVRVYGREHLLLTDRAPADEEVGLIQNAAEEDILLSVVRAPTGAATVAEGIARQAIESRLRLERARLIFVRADGPTGTDILANIGQLLGPDPDEARRRLHLEEKLVVLATDQRFPLIARPAQTAFNVLRPQNILLIHPEELPLLTSAPEPQNALEAIRAAGKPFSLLGAHSERAVSQLTPWNALSYVVNALVNAGVPTASIALILMLPIVATLLAFSRQVIGIKAFGMFTPAAVTLAFLAIGLKYGLVIFVVVLFAATASRVLLRRFRLLYLPRMAIVLTAVSFSVLALFGVGTLLRAAGTLAFSVFPILLLASLAEQFVEAQIRLGSRTATRLTLETLLLSVIATLIVRWETLRSLVVGFPELILLTIPFNILLGRWTGLRFAEYVRFRAILFSGTKGRP